jgi:hypothetical protein
VERLSERSVPTGGMRFRRAEIAVGLATFALALAGCGGNESEETSTTSADAPEKSTTVEGGGGPAEAPDGPEKAAEGTAELYFTAGEQFRKVERPLPEGGSELEATAEALVEGPRPADSSGRVATQTQIPPGTEVEGVELTDDGTAVVEVSSRFTRGIPEQAAERSRAEQQELNARLGQITYTLTAAKGVERAKVISGGIAVEPAIDRDDYRKPKGKPNDPRPRGNKSQATREVQERLARLHYLPKGAVDGVNGYRTQQAVMAFQAWEGLERDGIAGPITTAALADAKRPKPKADGPSRHIEVFRSKGVILLVKRDRVRRAIHVSAGGPGNETPTGTYSVFRKELNSWSVPFQTWLPYASYFNAGIAFHEYADVPPYPASHGCVRVPAPEAKGVYAFAKLDTTVIVY